MSTIKWHTFPDESRYKVCGLPWFNDNQPLLWRFPKDTADHLPSGVANKVAFPAGGRLYMKSNTTALSLKIVAKNKGNGKGLDIYLDDSFYKSFSVEEVDREIEVVFFNAFNPEEREIAIYLPSRQEIEIHAIGVDTDATLEALDPKFRHNLPIVFYGSSICQASSASKPGMTYSAIIGRALNTDFVNLGFGGSGKAEPEVVKLVNAIPACCYVFDLGRSYGLQNSAPYEAMLHAIQSTHPDTPILCITPTASSRELYADPQTDRSLHTRKVTHEAVENAQSAGVSNLHLVNGIDLLSFDELDGLSPDGLHPSDYGYHTIAQRLIPLLRKILR